MEGMEHFLRDWDNIMKTLKWRWMDGILKYRNEINEIYKLLSDDSSKSTYISEILMCELRNFLKGDLPSQFAGLMTNAEWNKHQSHATQLDIYKNLKTPPESNITAYCIAATFLLKQYQYKDFVKVNKGDICFDIGSCFGDTTLWFIEEGASLSHAFEIDKKNIESMKANFIPYQSQVIIQECAVSDKSETLYYIPMQGNLGAGRICNVPPAEAKEKDGYPVSTITLDEYCEDSGIIPNFIKMDIEGAELAAIRGGANIFRKYRPKFAICIYHTWAHRFEIPLLLQELCPDYNFYVKKSHPVCETVFFGAPKKESVNSIHFI